MAMNGLTQIVDNVRAHLAAIASQIRTRLLGANNERLDLLMDSFYKLSPPQRNLAVIGLIAAISFVVLGGVGFYFNRVNALKVDLNYTFTALRELPNNTLEYHRESARFEKLAETVVRHTRGQKLKPFLEKVAKEVDVQIEGLNEQRTPLPADNPLSRKIQDVRVDLRFPQVSIPRLLKFLVEIEKQGKYLAVQELQVRGRYGTRLYFDVQAKIRGYAAVGD